MRLTQVLKVFYPKNKRYPGLKYGGKTQKIMPVKTSAKISAVNYMMMEEQNLQYIQNNYMSSEEERQYGFDHPEIRRQKRKTFIENNRRPFFPNRTIEQHFESLNMNKKWE